MTMPIVAAFVAVHLLLELLAVGAHRAGGQLARRQPAHLEDQGGVGVIMADDHGVGGLAVVHVAEPAADGEDAGRKLLHAQEPAGDVHLVDALVAEVAVAGVPDPVPVVMQLLAHQGQLERRAAPEIVVNRGGHGLRAVHLADAGAAFVAEPAAHLDLAQVALPDPLDRGSDALAGGAALGAGLDDAVVLARELDNAAPFADVVRNRLLDVHILAGLDGPDRGQGVPVVGSGDGHRVHVLALEQLPDVRVGLDGPTPVGKLPGAAGQHVAVAIAQRGQAGALRLAQRANVAAALPMEADHSHPDIVVGAVHLRPDGRRQADGGRAQPGGFQKIAAVQVFHICGLISCIPGSVRRLELRPRCPGGGRSGIGR